MDKKLIKEIESELKMNPKFAEFFALKEWREEDVEYRQKKDSLVKGLFDTLGGKMRAYFQKKTLDDAQQSNKNTKQIINKMDEVRGVIQSKDDQRILDALSNLIAEVKAQELTVNVEPPNVNVAIPEPKLIPETKEATLTNQILAKLFQVIAKKDNGVTINNSTPSEAIPVVLTNAGKKKFYDAITQALSSTGYNAPPFVTPDGTPKAPKLDDEGHLIVTFDRDPYNQFFRERIVGLLLVLIADFTVPLGQELVLQGVSFSGTSASEWNIRQNGIDVTGGYTSAAAPALPPSNFGDGTIVFNEGDLLELFVLHTQIPQQNFQGNIFGYFRPIII